MTIAFWALAALALTTAFAQFTSAWRVRRYYRPIDSDVPTERKPVSVLVALAGRARGRDERLGALVRATREGDQLLLALETADDPAHGAATDLRRAHPERDIAIVLAGPAGARQHKQHALAAALPHAVHALVAGMDEDVELEGPNVDEGVRLAGVPNAGAVFAIPYYAGSGRPGGALVAAYANYGFGPAMASLAIQGAPRFILGSFWVAQRHALEVAGGFEPHARSLSDDVSIGRALHATGRRNRPMRRPVRLAYPPLHLAAGAHQVRTSLTLLRARGGGLFGVIAIAWNALALALSATLIAAATPSVTAASAAATVASVVVLRTAAVVVLNRGVYRALGRARFLASTLLYEALVAPWLYALAAFRRDVVWRGRHYRIGSGGVITDA